MKRCFDRGRERSELLVGAAVLANNLLRIATLLQEAKRGGQTQASHAGDVCPRTRHMTGLGSFHIAS
jgi:hypothetical protein